MSHDERATIDQELTPPFLIHAPARQALPLVLSSPHSGSIYPRSFLAASRLDAMALRRSEDCYVDELFMGAVEAGAPLIAARFPRAYLDVNREPYELDPSLFRERLPEYANTHSIRVVGGLGTIARVVSESQEIYRERLSLADGLARIDHLYRPYHAALAGLLESTRDQFGAAILIDCHSMPSSTASGSPARPDIVLGDRFGSSCEPSIVQRLRHVLVGRGLNVVLNRPYAGGFITEHYGRPSQSLHAVQIEINRSLYMDEDTLERTAGFTVLQAHLAAVIRELVAPASGSRLAAE